MSELVEGGGDDHAAEQDEQQRRLVEHASQPLAEAVESEQPDVESDEGEDDRRHHRRPEQRPEERRRRAHEVGGNHARAEAEREQRVDLLHLGGHAVALGDQAEAAQLPVEEHLDHLGVDAALDAVTQRLRDLGGVAPAVDLLGERVEDGRELDDLPVLAAREVRRLLEARVLVAPDELDLARQARNVERLRSRRAAQRLSRAVRLRPGSVARCPA